MIEPLTDRLFEEFARPIQSPSLFRKSLKVKKLAVLSSGAAKKITNVLPLENSIFPSFSRYFKAMNAKRRSEFIVSRLCLLKLAWKHFPSSLSCLNWASILRFPKIASERRSFLWPNELVGSLTHKDNFVFVALAKKNSICSLGVDSEKKMSLRQAQILEKRVSFPEEMKSLTTKGLSYTQSLTLIFSAKESVFKCLSSFLRTPFGFKRIELDFKFFLPFRGLFRIKKIQYKTLEKNFFDLKKLEGWKNLSTGEWDFKNPFVHTSYAIERSLRS